MATKSRAVERVVHKSMRSVHSCIPSNEFRPLLARRWSRGRLSDRGDRDGEPDDEGAHRHLRAVALDRERSRPVLDGGDVRERRLAKFRQNVARFRLYRLRFLQENMRLTAFFKIYQIF